MYDLLITNIAEIVTMAAPDKKPLTGKNFQNPSIIYGGAIAIKDGNIALIGKSADVNSKIVHSAVDQIVDAKGKTVIPGFVDGHTHLVFSGSREYEFLDRIEKLRNTHNVLMSGGINHTVAATRKAPVDDLLFLGEQRLKRMLQYGTTTIEAKSGYGLDTSTEIKILETTKKLNGIQSIEIVTTFLGAHAIPGGMTSDKYTDLIIKEMIPEVAKHKLAEFCDVFCEVEFFSYEQSKRILQAGLDHGMIPKIHADELSNTQGAQLAAEVGAISADHLLHAEESGLKAMAEKGTIAVLLPGTSFALNLKEYANATLMRELGVPIALSTDFNPGSCFCENMQLILTLACLKLKMTPLEALAAATINAAYAINRGETLGSLEVGKQADILIMDAPNHDYIPYHFGANLVSKVIKKGQIVYQAN